METIIGRYLINVQRPVERRRLKWAETGAIYFIDKDMV